MTNFYHKRTTKKKSMVETDLDVNTTIDPQLEREYIIQDYYECGPMCANWSLVFVLLCLCLFYYPGARYSGTISAIWGSLYYVVRKHIDRYRDTDHAERAMNIFREAFNTLGLINEILLHRNNESLSSEEGRNAHVSLVILATYFIGNTMNRISAPRCHNHHPLVSLIAMPLIAFKFPRFGIYQPYHEALAFFVVMALSEFLGFVVDDLRWKNFKKNQEIQRQKIELWRTKRWAMALEGFARREETFFEIRSTPRMKRFSR